MATAPRLKSLESALRYRRTKPTRRAGPGGYQSKARSLRFLRREETPPGPVLERARLKAGSSAYKFLRSHILRQGALAKGIRRRCEIGRQRSDVKFPRTELTRQAQ